MRLISIALCLILTGCANGYSQFYHDRTGGIDITQYDAAIISNDTPTVYRGRDLEADSLGMLQNGYMMVGYSSYNGANGSESQIIQQARKAHATMAISYSEYTSTRSGVIPLTLPDTQTSTTNMSGSVYGSGGYASMTGTATTTTTGSKTTYIPYSTDRYDFIATYWVKLKPQAFGAYFENLSQEQRREIGSNKGALLTIIVNGSPAFNADFFPGDIIRKVNNAEVVDIESFSQLIRRHKGQSVTIELVRDNETIGKQVQLNN